MNTTLSYTIVPAGIIYAGLALFAGTASAQQCSPTEVAKLLASDAMAISELGYAVSISGNLAVIGARNDADDGIDSGSAYIYRNDGTNWVQEAKLLASDRAAGDFFGAAVSISGEVAVIGADRDDDAGIGSGSAYVYRFDGTNWVEDSKLTASDSAENDRFGKSVSISGEIAVVGAQWNDDGGSSSGSAYIYRYDGVNWVEESKLLASDGEAFDNFGASVSVSGEVALVASADDDDNGTSSGSVYVFRYDGTNWVQETKLSASDGTDNDQFGYSVSISGDVAVIGAWLDDVNKGTNYGSAYVFRYDDTSWVQESKLIASDGGDNDLFGFAVSVSGETVVVGARGHEDNGIDSGSAYVYRNDGTNWVEEAKLSASDPGAFDRFGHSVSVSGDVAIFGSPWNDDNANASGSAYVFDLDCLAPCAADLSGDGVLNFLDVSAFVAAFSGGDSAADFSGDGILNFLDVSAFVAAFSAGCP